MKLLVDKANLEASIKDFQQAIKETDNRLGGMKNSLSNVGTFIKGAFGVTAVLAFWKQVFTLTSQVEWLKKSFTTLTGSVEWSNKMLADIDSFAKKTPFSKMEIAKNAQLLMGFWFQAKQVLPTLQAIGNAVSAMWGSQDQMNGVVLAIGQIYTKGKVSAQEMMQLAERGIPAWDILAKWLNKTVAETQKIVENGGVSAGQGLEIILTGFQERFNGSLEAQSQTLAGKWSNLMDSIEQSLASFGDNITGYFTAWIDQANNFVDSILPRFFFLFEQIARWWANIAQVVSWIFDFFGEKWGDMTGNQLAQNASMLEKVWLLWDFTWAGVLWSVTWVFDTILDYAFQAWDALFNSTTTIGERIKWIFIWAWSAILNSILWIVNNTVNLLMIPINNAILGLNQLITLANKVPWIKVNTIWSITADFKVGDGKWIFDKVGDGIATVLADIWWKVRENITKNLEQVSANNPLQKLSKSFDLNTLDGMGKQINNLKKEMGGLTIGTDAYIKKQKELKDLTDKQRSAFWFTGGGWGGGSGWSGWAKKENEALKKSVDHLKDSYKILDNEITKVENARKKEVDAERKWHATLQQSQQDTVDSLVKVRDEYDKTVAKLNEDSTKQSIDSTGDYYRSLLEEKKKLEKDAVDETVRLSNEWASAGWIAHFNEYQWPTIDPNNDALGYIKYVQTYGAATQLVGGKVIKDIEAINAQIKELELAQDGNGKNLLDQNSLTKEKERNSLTDQEKSRFDFMEKYGQIQLDLANNVSAATDKFAESRGQIEGMQNIVNAFENTKLRGSGLDSLAKSLKLQNTDKEAQALVDKLLTEKRNLITITDERISAESRVHAEAMRLSTAYHVAELDMVRARKTEYDDLIAKIRVAIDMANALRAAQASVWVSSSPSSSKKWFSEGGYTGDGAVSDVAGVVHKGVCNPSERHRSYAEQYASYHTEPRGTPSG